MVFGVLLLLLDVLLLLLGSWVATVGVLPCYCRMSGLTVGCLDCCRMSGLLLRMQVWRPRPGDVPSLGERPQSGGTSLVWGNVP